MGGVLSCFKLAEDLHHSSIVSLAKNYLPSSCLYWSKASKAVLIALRTHLLQNFILAEVVYGPASASSLSYMY